MKAADKDLIYMSHPGSSCHNCSY